MNKVCEGFAPPEHWKSGRHSAPAADPEQDETPSDATVEEIRAEPLPKLIPGVEDETDRMLLDHFILNMSQSLCSWNGKRSPFDSIIVPMALSDLGLMHAILCLSGFQLESGSCRSNGTDVSYPRVVERRLHHLDRALSLLREKLRNSGTNNAPQRTDDATIATIAMLCMRTVVAGESHGEHRIHLNAGLESLAMSHHSNSSEFLRFMTGFFAYHDISCFISSIRHRSSYMEDDSFKLPNFVSEEAGIYFGVLDGLFVNISKINNLRSRIRERQSKGLQPILDTISLHSAQVIDADLQDWTTVDEGTTPRALVRQLYRQCTWIYLYRTIYHQYPSENLLQGVDNGLSLFTQVQDEDEVQPILLMPIFLLGCAAFEERHRQRINAALDSLETKRGCGNIRHVRRVIREIWLMMDHHDSKSWDWETLMDSMGLNFLIA